MVELHCTLIKKQFVKASVYDLQTVSDMLLSPAKAESIMKYINQTTSVRRFMKTGVGSLFQCMDLNSVTCG